MADGDEADGVGCMSDSGRYSDDGSGSDECETGTMPSGVDCRLAVPLRAKSDDVDAGLVRDEGMLMADVMRGYGGLGERERAGSRGRSSRAWSEFVETEAMSRWVEWWEEGAG
jgi:hypothetical protein